jgi:hypothetical protein
MIKILKRLAASEMKCLRHLLGTTELDRERTQSFREKLGELSIVRGISASGYNAQTAWTQTGYPN